MLIETSDLFPWLVVGTCVVKNVAVQSFGAVGRLRSKKYLSFCPLCVPLC